MHRLAATPGGWNFQEEGVIFVEQTPAPIVFLTAADTDIQTFAAAVGFLPEGFPALRAVNLLQLQQQLSIDTYAEQVLAQAQVIIIRLLGGRSYWSYGLEVVRETVEKSQKTLIVIPGDDRPDPHLLDRSTVSLTVVNQLWRYFTEGGVQNFVNALKFVADLCLGQTYNPPPPAEVPRVGLYRWGRGNGEEAQLPLAKVGILFYRAHYLAGNTTVIDALCQALCDRKLQPVPIFVSSLREPDVQAELWQYCQPKDTEQIDILLNTTSFSISDLGLTMQSPIPNPQSPIENLDVPVLQVIFSSGTVEQWESGFKGLSPRDMAMNVALPEVDGRIISRAISFKAVQSRHPQLETDVVGYEPQLDRIAFVADLALNWVRLRKIPVSERKIALILANYPNRDGRLANGVGLDTPASCVEILKALQEAGYDVENLPETSDELIARLTAGVTNDPEGRELRQIWQQLPLEEYNEYFASLPKEVQKQICDRWGTLVEGKNEESFSSTTPLAISGIQLGNVFVGIQPSRGYDIDPSLNYHAPDLEPTHAYLAFYYWVRQHFQANAIVHVGKHGNLEWLPGKSVALSSNCYPEVALGAMPHFYPFIVNDPGEGSQAKRRAQAVIIDHLTPPMTRAELYGPLQQLESSIDEYYEAQSLDPKRLPMIADRIAQLVAQENLQQDLEASQNLKVKNQNKEFSTGNFDISLLSLIDGYLCELKEAQIRDGLHIFGQCPQGRQLRDLIVAIARHPGTNRLGLTRAIAKDWGWDFDPLTADPSLSFVGQASVGQASRLSLISPSLIQGGQDAHPTRYQTAGDAIELLEEHAANLVEQLIATDNEQQTIERRQGVSSLPFQDESSINFDEFQALSDRCEANPKSQIQNPKSDDSGQDTVGELTAGSDPSPTPPLQGEGLSGSPFPRREGGWGVRFFSFANSIGKLTKRELDWISTYLLPALQQTQQEISQLLRGLDGRFVPSGPSGAPTRGRPEVLPTGRNFYSVDIRSLPTETAWNVGRKAAETLIEQYTQSNGEYPKTLGLSVWGTATMRTGGDDVAQALALLGVRPVWDGPSRRVVDFEILPVSVLGRPRVDVTLRISGFFRDAFPNLIDLFDRAVAGVAALNEPPEDNPLAAQVKQERQLWLAAGLNEEQAEMRSHYRIFGSKPGAYGAGLQGLIEAQNWTDEQDLARAYINWSSYAYTSSHRVTEEQENPKSQIQNPKFGIAAPEAFEQRLRQMQIVLHNQDNREHDLLDSDDYYQFQGGLTAAVRALTGKNPQTYFGDNSIPENPKVRQLQSEIARVYRSRVVNPKWIAGVMRHGYKGAFEMSATVDYLFAYDATANCVEDFMYRGVAEAYLFEPSVQEFIQQKNPWALRDMAERLLEAHQRGLWKGVESEMIEKLRSIVHQAEGAIESTSFMQF